MSKTYPEGHFIGMWMCIGMALCAGVGIPLSIATDNLAFIGVGSALGVAIGMAVGSSIEEKRKQEGKIKPLTDRQRKSRKTALTTGIIFLTGLFIFGIVLFFLK